jgi:hypothetical protein
MQFHDRELNRWLLPREDQRHSCRSAANGEADDLKMTSLIDERFTRAASEFLTWRAAFWPTASL